MREGLRKCAVSNFYLINVALESGDFCKSTKSVAGGVELQVSGGRRGRGCRDPDFIPC